MAQKRCLATFQPQAWIDDNAWDIDGAIEFDITDQVKALGRAAALAIKDNRDESDELWFKAGGAQVQADAGHSGPFSVRCEEAIAAFYGVER